MNKINRRLFLGTAASALVAASLARAEGTIRVGVVMPFSGPAAAYGAEAKQAVELAAEEINAQGGILGGQSIELVFEDDQGKTQTAVGATQKLISVAGVSAILGGMGSQLALAQSSVTKDKVVYINTAAQADAITDQGIGWLFQINNTTSMNAAAFNGYLVKDLKPTTVAFIGENTEFARGLLAILEADLQTAGIQLLDTATYDTETTDFTSIITKTKSLNPDLVYVADGAPARLVQLFKQIRQVGGFQKELVVPGVVTPAVLTAAEGAMNGVITGDIFTVEDDNPQTQAFVEAFRAKYTADPGKVHLVVYEGMKVLAGAMNAANSATDPAVIAEAMRANTWETPRGTLRFDEEGRAHAPFFFIQEVSDTQLKLVARYSN